MENIPQMIWKEVRKVMETSGTIFEKVRLVDPVKSREIRITPEGTLKEDTSCFSYLNADVKCSNCSSIRAYHEGQTVAKIENMQDGIYQVLSKPISVTDADGHSAVYVMEMIAKTENKDDVKKHKTILVVEDQEINRSMIARLLQKDYDVLEASDGEKCLKILNENYAKISAIILDLIMPKMDGFAVLEYMAKDSRFANIPILVTTGERDYTSEKKCLELGAWDFISKPINKDTLLLRLHNIIGRSKVDTQEYEKYLVEHDRLTGLYNRNKFFEVTRWLLDSNPDKEYAFIRVDLDRFRLYNSFFGEEEGDTLLVYFANKIHDKVSKFGKSAFGRIESDIFGVCIEYKEEFIEELQYGIVEDLRDYNTAYYIEPSIGVYLIEDRKIPIESMYDRSSMAAEQCKHKFMAYIGYYNESMTKQLVIEQEIMNDAQKALDNEEFEVYLQPKTIIHTEECYGAEALVRWIHPEKGMISPGKFIPVFESNGFIGRLDYYMWDHTCKLLRNWIDEGLEPDPVSVNVSRANMYNPNLVFMLKSLLDKYDLPARFLQLELTESAFMDEPDMMIQKVQELQEIGFVILMDDFGSGYSSLNTLKDIPVDVLKVDMKFLGNGDGDGKSERILASVVRMAAWLNLVVIVEGVETKEQRDFLEGIGCEYAQGFYYARPMPWREYEAILKNMEIRHHVDGKQSDDNILLDKIWMTNPEMKRVFHVIMQAAAIFEYKEDTITLLQANKQFSDRFSIGDTSQDYLAKNNHLIPEYYIKQIYQSFEECVMNKAGAECDYLQLDDQGKSLWYHMKVQYITKGDNGYAILAFFHDVTQEKQLEREVQRFKAISATAGTALSKMLVVDDLEISRAVVAELFKDEFEVVEASNGLEALDVLEENGTNISIILLDMYMPVMDGAEFLRCKNKIKQYADIPVIIISAEDSENCQVDMLELGVNDYVTKPFVPEVVRRRVRNVLEYNSRFRDMQQEYRRNKNRK